MKKIAVVGTDTGVGKTRVTCSLLKQLTAMGFQTLGLKPLASGCGEDLEGLSDGSLLQRASSLKVAYEVVNPIALPLAAAPHLVAKSHPLSVSYLQKLCEPAFSQPVDYLVMEGAGGWLVPLNEKETLADFFCALKVPLLLVVGIRLGCLNHALLTWESMRSRGVSCIGWVANCVTFSMMLREENIQDLKKRLPIPLLGIFPYEETLGENAPSMDLYSCL